MEFDKITFCKTNTIPIDANPLRANLITVFFAVPLTKYFDVYKMQSVVLYVYEHIVPIIAPEIPSLNIKTKETLKFISASKKALN